MNYEAAYLGKLEAIVLSMGGVVPAMTTPTSFERRSLELLDAMATASAAAAAGAAASALLVGSSTLIPYPVTIANQLYTDPAGWLWYAPNGGSIGNALSGSTVASAKLEQLFYRLWEHLNLATPEWIIQTSVGGAAAIGATAAADWAAGKRLLVPDQRGRSPVAAGQGPGLTNRLVGWQGGAETHSLTGGENGAHVHAPPVSGQYTVNTNVGNQAYGFTTGAGQLDVVNGNSTASAGLGTPHNNMQPFANYLMLWFTGQKA